MGEMEHIQICRSVGQHHIKHETASEVATDQGVDRKWREYRFPRDGVVLPVKTKITRRQLPRVFTTRTDDRYSLQTNLCSRRDSNLASSDRRNLKSLLQFVVVAEIFVSTDNENVPGIALNFSGKIQRIASCSFSLLSTSLYCESTDPIYDQAYFGSKQTYSVAIGSAQFAAFVH